MSDILTASVLAGVYLLGFVVGTLLSRRDRGVRAGLIDLSGWHGDR